MRSDETRQVLVATAVSALVVLGAWLFIPGERKAPPARAEPPARAVAVLPMLPTPEPAGVDAEPALPHVLPASNAFTTLADYRRRQAAKPRALEPLAPPPPGRTPETELGQATFAVRDFRAAFGSNPVGSNREITRALLGDNPRGAKLLDASTARLNARGELLDAWGRPYFFHAMSGTAMEIRSAGPDGKIFTDDDLVQ